jgi:cholesterol transport system auxiliary component
MPAGFIHRTLSVATLSLLLAAMTGCVRIGEKPPERLLGIATEARVNTGATQSGTAQSALFVETPAVPRALGTQRVAVQVDPTSYAYVQKALWADTPAHQFRALLAETISARTSRLVLDPGQYPAQPANVLHGELTEFGVDAAQHRAIVTFDATLVGPDGQTVRRQRFSATAPLGKIDNTTVAPAISKAANDVAAAVADWVAKP